MTDTPSPRQARRLSPDMIAALSAVVIGVCALGVSLYQAAIMREQSQMMREEQRASVWPNVAMEDSYAEGVLKLRLVNTGIGPARLGPVRVTFDGEPVQTWTALIRKVYPAQSIRYTQSQVGARVMPAGDFETVLALSDTAMADSVRTHLHRVAIEVCYCSVYDACWRYVQRFDGDDLRESVEQCRETESDFLQ